MRNRERITIISYSIRLKRLVLVVLLLIQLGTGYYGGQVDSVAPSWSVTKKSTINQKSAVNSKRVVLFVALKFYSLYQFIVGFQTARTSINICNRSSCSAVATPTIELHHNSTYLTNATLQIQLQSYIRSFSPASVGVCLTESTLVTGLTSGRSLCNHIWCHYLPKPLAWGDTVSVPAPLQISPWIDGQRLPWTTRSELGAPAPPPVPAPLLCIFGTGEAGHLKYVR